MEVKLTKYTEDITRLWNAIAFMKNAHEGQVDKCGQPYWIHPFTVAMNCLGKYYVNEILPEDRTLSPAVIGALHDVIEDTHYTLEEVKDHLSLTDDECEALQLLTHSDNTSYDEYIERIINSDNMIAVKVKLEDTMHNGDVFRFTEAGISVTNEDLEKLGKYLKASKRLLDKVREEIENAH